MVYEDFALIVLLYCTLTKMDVVRCTCLSTLDHLSTHRQTL